MSKIGLSCPICAGELTTVVDNIYKCNHCGKFYTLVGDELIAGGQHEAERIARKLVSDRMKTIMNLLAAKRIFDSLGDSNSIAASEEISKEIIRLKERRKRIKEIATRVVAFTLTIIAIFLLFDSIKEKNNERKQATYDMATEEYNAGNLEGAIALWDELGDFCNSKEMIKLASEMIEDREDTYNKGVSYFEAGLYSKAISEFIQYPNYLDSDIYIEKCAAALLDKARSYYESGNIDSALEILTNFPVNTESSIVAEALLSEINEELEEKKLALSYDTAICDYDNGDFIPAQINFMSLGNYRDSKEYLEKIGSTIYDMALNYYDEGNYPQAGDMIAYIDTETEWASYQRACELLDNVKNAYEEKIIPKAKDTCRADGYQAMVSFLDSNVCSVLSQSRADQLKSTCSVSQVWLKDLKAYYWGNGISTYDYAEDTMGTTWSEPFVGVSSDDDNYVIYDIGKKYQVMSFKLTVFEPYWHESVEENEKGAIYIYGDGALLWCDDQISILCKPYDVSINISGVTDLRIQMRRCHSLRPMMTNITLSD